MDKENNAKNTYDDGNIPEVDLPGQNRHGNEPSGQNRHGDEPSGQGRYDGDTGENYDDSNSNPTGEDHLVWVTPPVLLADAEGSQPSAACGI